jgi:hypothetical protein
VVFQWYQVQDYPELKEDLVFASQLGVKFNSDNIFGQSIEIENTIKSIDFINGMMDLKEKSGDEEISYFSQDFLIKRWLDLSAEDRAREGLFLAFQYPIEIPGVSTTNFIKAAVNEKRKYQGLEPLDAAQFLKIMKEKMKMDGPGYDSQTEENMLPDRYNMKSDITREIVESGPNEFNFDLKAK